MRAVEFFCAVRRLLFASLLLSASGATAAVDRSEWRLSQPLDVAAPGLIKVALPTGMLGALRPEAADLRLLDPTAAKVAWFPERPLRFAAEAPVGRMLPAPPVSLHGHLLASVTLILSQLGGAVGGSPIEAAHSISRASAIQSVLSGGYISCFTNGQTFHEAKQGPGKDRGFKAARAALSRIPA